MTSRSDQLQKLESISMLIGKDLKVVTLRDIALLIKPDQENDPHEVMILRWFLGRILRHIDAKDPLTCEDVYNLVIFMEEAGVDTSFFDYNEINE